MEASLLMIEMKRTFLFKHLTFSTVNYKQFRTKERERVSLRREWDGPRQEMSPEEDSMPLSSY